MPINFTCEQQKPFTIERDGTVFYFDLDEGIIKRVKLNATIAREHDFGAYMLNFFRFALFKWENLLDEKENPIDFTPGMRDALVLKSDVFTEKDLFDFMEHFDQLGKSKEPDTPKSDSEGPEPDTDGTGD